MLFKHIYLAVMYGKKTAVLFLSSKKNNRVHGSLLLSGILHLHVICCLNTYSSEINEFMYLFYTTYWYFQHSSPQKRSRGRQIFELHTDRRGSVCFQLSIHDLIKSGCFAK